MIKILHLYPSLMNLYGDYANVLALEKHLKDQGKEVIVDKKEIFDSFNFEDYDFVFLGSGTESNTMIVLNQLMDRKSELRIYVEEGGVCLFVGQAMDLLAKNINGQEALGLFDFSVTFSDKRFTGDVIVANDEMREVVGFINKSSIINGSSKYKLFDYLFKTDGLDDNNFEGYHYKNLYATHIIGPILLKNPNFMKIIVKLLLKDQEYKNINYQYEQASYLTTLNALKERMK